MKNLTAGNRSRAVAIWLLVGVFMIIVQIILGGITRLTDSGLSITEWQPILGAIPPRTEEEWSRAFEQYQQIAQYKELHAYFSLEDFKSIFFWEWLHRLWGRLIGIVFIIPFVVFLIQKRFDASMVKPMIILFLLGGLQGLIGWIMVMSGLNNEDLYVSHIRLAIHFMVALLLLVYTFWFALQLLVSDEQRLSHKSSKGLLSLITILLTIQLVYGAFMAGLKAATAAPTWPDINGAFVPSNMSSFGGRTFSFFSSLINHPIMVHFIHRNLGYLILILIVWWWVKKQPVQHAMWKKVKQVTLALVSLQVLLGILSVLTSPNRQPRGWGSFEWSALLHQAVAMFLLLSIVFAYYISSGSRKLTAHPY